MAPEENADAPILRAALSDGVNAAFVLLERFPHHDHEHTATLEPIDLFHKSTEEQILDLQRRHGAYAIVALIDGLTNIATRYLDTRADTDGTTRQALLNELRATVADRHTKEQGNPN